MPSQFGINALIATIRRICITKCSDCKINKLFDTTKLLNKKNAKICVIIDSTTYFRIFIQMIFSTSVLDALCPSLRS